MSKQFYIYIYITNQFSVSTVLMSKAVPFQTVQFSISTQFKCKYGLIGKTFLFQTIRFRQRVLVQTVQFGIGLQPRPKNLVCTTICP